MWPSILITLFGVIFTPFSYGEDAPPSIAEQLSQITSNADSVTVEYLSEMYTAEYTFADQEWIMRLAATLKSTTYEKREHCWCISLPRIKLNTGDETILRMGIHHGEKLRTSGQSVSGDFFIGKEAATAIATLINEKIER